ncbi:ATP-binding protein [Acinetobacter gyllenbergii]|nr:ATP-binding protein [Acinetobacter gyllenbergii]
MDLKDYQNLVDAALSGNSRVGKMVLKKVATKIKITDPELYDYIKLKLSDSGLRSVENAKPLPVDTDSRLNLVRLENPAICLDSPVLSTKSNQLLEQVLEERGIAEKLQEIGLSPCKTILFEGPPGVGKTMSSRWLAKELDLPLLILDLATVMSSFLGKTGNNIRAVLDYASSFPCVLLLDEFDAIAKRRDDDRELGELKRLVTVLLQALDDWPESSLLIAATNHSELLDPAIWRRFDLQVSFDLPNNEMVEKYISQYYPEISNIKKPLSEKFNGKSFSDIDRIIKLAKKESILKNKSIYDCLSIPISLENIDEDAEVTQDYENLSKTEKIALIPVLHEKRLSQRKIAELLKVSRPIVKKTLELHDNEGI